MKKTEALKVGTVAGQVVVMECDRMMIELTIGQKISFRAHGEDFGKTGKLVRVDATVGKLFVDTKHEAGLHELYAKDYRSLFGGGWVKTEVKPKKAAP